MTWQQIDTGIDDADLIKLSDTLFYSPMQNSVGVLSGGVITWTLQDPYPNGREGPGICAISPTKLLAYGGYTDSTLSACVSEAYIGTITGSTLAWSAATSGPKAKATPNLVRLNDGRVLIANGSNPPTDGNFSYGAMFATVSGTTITYGEHLESEGGGWYSWQKSVVMADGRILSITPYHSGSPNYNPQFQLTTVSGNTLTVVSDFCNISRIGIAPTGWFAPGLCVLGDGHIIVGGGCWYDSSLWRSDQNIYVVNVFGDTVTLTYLLDMPYVIADGSAGGHRGTSIMGLESNKVYVNGQSWSLGGYTESVQVAGAVLAATASAAPSVTASLTAIPAGMISATITSVSSITAQLSIGVKLIASASATPTISSSLTTKIKVNSSILAVATASAALLTGIKLAASPAATPAASLSWSGAATHALSGSLTATPSISAPLTVAIKLAASASATSTATAQLSTQVKLNATATANPTITAGLRGNHALSAAVIASPGASANLLAKIRLAGSLAVAPSIAAALRLDARLAANIAASTVTTASMTTKIKLVGAVSAQPFVLARFEAPWEGHTITVRQRATAVYVLT